MERKWNLLCLFGPCDLTIIYVQYYVKEKLP